MKSIIRTVLIIWILTSISCGGDPEPRPIQVHIAGIIGGVSGPFQPAYWKDGNLSVLSHSETWGYAWSVFVSGKDVYIAGNTYNTTTEKFRALYWKNGVPVYLSDGSNSATANSIYIDGEDIYVAGAEIVSGGGFYRARYWKNGSPVNLTDGSSTAIANRIDVKKGNIYVAGYESIAGKNVPTLWTNGVAVAQGPPEKAGQANGLFIDGTTTYTCGGDASPQTGVYWKSNNQRSEVDNGYWLRGIAVDKNNIYTVGLNDDFDGSIWKNGEETVLSVGGDANDIFLFERKPYVAGYKNKSFNGSEYSIAAYWMNGEEVELEPEPTDYSFAHSIFIKR